MVYKRKEENQREKVEEYK